MDRHFEEKALQELPMTVEEALQLDAELEKGASRAVAGLVSQLPDNPPSLAWRSSLNDRLMRLRVVPRPVRVWIAGAAATAAVALCSLLWFPTLQRGGQADRASVVGDSQQSLEEAILAEHQDSAGHASLGVYASFAETGS